MDGFVPGEYWHSETDTTGCYFYSTLMYFPIAYTLLLVRRLQRVIKSPVLHTWEKCRVYIFPKLAI